MPLYVTRVPVHDQTGILPKRKRERKIKMKEVMDYETARLMMSLYPAHCIICAELTKNRREYVPEDPRQFGQQLPPPGKTRGVIYAICEKHPDNKKTMREVKRKLAAETN